jgi:hypothetical protein
VEVDLFDERAVYPVEMAGKLLGAAPGAKLDGERLGQGGEAGDVGEQHGAVGAVGQSSAPRHRKAAVGRDICQSRIERGVHKLTRPG